MALLPRSTEIQPYVASIRPSPAPTHPSPNIPFPALPQGLLSDGASLDPILHENYKYLPPKRPHEDLKQVYYKYLVLPSMLTFDRLRA